MDLTQVKQTYEVFSKLQFVTLKKYIKGIPNLRKVRKKTSVQGGGKKRTRYKDKKGNIYEWDYRHGTLEYICDCFYHPNPQEALHQALAYQYPQYLNYLHSHLLWFYLEEKN
jgi:hypothetical protein